MRSAIMILAILLLAACGGTPAEDRAPTNAGSGSGEGQSEAPVDDEEPTANAAGGPQTGSVSPCLMQGADRLNVPPIRAVGTEPFWGARVEGRCVTYSTPENQQGTRVWTRYTPGDGASGSWTGRLDGAVFELRARPEPACSDGMSDQRYPIAVELTVGGEQRRGCAVPL